MSHLARNALALLVVLLLGTLRPAAAQGAIGFGDISATADFPNEIVFRVTVESSADIVHLELSYRVTGDPYTKSRLPSFSAGRRVTTSYRLDTQVEFYSPGTEITYYWTATDAAGHVAESAAQTLLYEDNRFTWREARNDRVAVYWYEGPASFGQQVLDTAVRTLERLEQDAGVQTTRLIRIYLYTNERDFRGALGPNAAEWIGGQAITALGIIVANIDPDYESEIGRMIPHEVSHIVLYQATHNPYAPNPSWLEEGIAVHNQEVADADYPYIVEEAARNGELIPLRALSADFPSDTDLAILSYAESSSIIEFILDRYGQEGLTRLVAVFAEGETAEAAVQRALGISLEELEAQWRATLPAAERTPVPGATARPQREQDTGSLERVLRIVASAMACTFLLAIGVVIAAVVIIVRRQRRQREQP